jgi:hypothetical protein
MWQQWDISELNKNVGKPQGLGRPRHRWVDNTELKETGWKDVYWIKLAQDRVRLQALLNTVLNLLF